MSCFSDSYYKYIEIVAEIYCQSIDETGERIDSTAPSNFENRLSHGWLKNTIQEDCSYKRYLQDDYIQNALNEFRLDKRAFWYFLLFVMDYTYTSCNDTEEFNPSPEEEIKRLIAAIKENIIEFEKIRGFKVKDPTATLTLKVKGQRNVVLSSIDTLPFMAYILEQGLKQRYKDIFYTRRGMKAQHINEPNTLRIAFFTKMLLSLFKSEIHGKPKQSKMKFIAYLVYWGKLSDNRNYIRTEKNERPLTKEENGKGYKLRDINGIKWIVVPFDSGKYLADQIKSYKDKLPTNSNIHYFW